MKIKPNNRRNFIKKTAIGLFAARLMSDAGVFNPAKKDSNPDNPVLTDKILGAFLGIGNMVNCGLAIMIMPIGAVNEGSPVDEFFEAVIEIMKRDIVRFHVREMTIFG